MATGDTVERIKERLSIVDVVSTYVELHPAGKNLKGKSPFTNERTPSFYVSPERGMYYCFSSSQGGDIFTFVEKMEGLDFKGALKLLAERAGVELVPEDPQKKSERERLFDTLEAATIFYTDWLARKSEARAYLEGRGVKSSTIAKWRLGYAPGPDAHGWREAKQHLEDKGFTKIELTKAGLIKGTDGGKEPYDVFRDRIMFPIFDPSGRVVGFSGRILHPSDQSPKYVNSPETELFHKSELLFGYDKAKQSIRSMDFSLIVEGQFDVIMSHQAGYTNAVAVSGTALTLHHIGLLQRLSNRVVLALDSDKAGIAAVKRAAELMLARGMDVKVAKMEGGKDPADMVVADLKLFKTTIGQAQPVVEFLLDVTANESRDERSFKLKVREEVLPFVVRIPNLIDQEHFEHLIAKRLSTTKEAIHSEVERLRNKITAPEPTNRALNESTSDRASDLSGDQDRLDKQRSELLAYLVVLVEVVEDEVARPLGQALERITEKSLQELRQALSAEQLSHLIFTLEEEVSRLPRVQLLENIAHQLAELEKRVYKDKLRQLQLALRQAEGAGKETTNLINELVAVQKKIGQISYQADDFK